MSCVSGGRPPGLRFASLSLGFAPAFRPRFLSAAFPFGKEFGLGGWVTWVPSVDPPCRVEPPGHPGRLPHGPGRAQLTHPVLQGTCLATQRGGRFVTEAVDRPAGVD